MTFDNSQGLNPQLQKLGLAIMIGLALLVRLHGLDHESMWMDEIRQVSYYDNGFTSIIKSAAEQQQPPLDYWIGRIVFKLSKTDFAARLPSALFGTGAIFLLVIIIWKNCSWLTAITTGLYASLLPFPIYYSQEARPYSIAIFFFLALILSLYEIFSRTRPAPVHYLLLLLSSTLFLYSRNLSPLCVYTTIVLLLVSGGVYNLYSKPVNKSELVRKFLYSFVALVLALCLYLPVLTLLMQTSASLTGESMSIDLSTIGRGLSEFTLVPLWEALITQFEPLGIIFFASISAGVILVFKSDIRARYNLLAWLVTLLLLTTIIHTYIYHMMTDYPFRPAYAIYILPLGLIISAIVFESAWRYVNSFSPTAYSRTVLGICLLVPFILVADSTINLKYFRHKTDWRALSEYINQNPDNENSIYLFDSISPFNRWKPVFYGTVRYPVQEPNALAVPYLIIQAPLFASSAHMPVLILFNYRNYYLTEGSAYPLVPIPDGTMTLEASNFLESTDLNISRLLGITIISADSQTGNFLYDSYGLLNKITASLPINDSTLDLFLTRAALAALCEDSGKIATDLLQKIINSTGVSELQYNQLASDFIDQHLRKKAMNPDRYCTINSAD